MKHVNPWLVLSVVCLAQFMVVLDATIVNVALPSIQADLNMAEGDLQWVVNAYTLTFGGFLLLGGRAGDLLGRKRVFLVGLVVFTLASLLNGLADSSTTLILARGLQGFGAALISPAALSIITTTFAEGPERNKAMGVWAAIATGGAAADCSRAASSSSFSRGRGSSSSTSRSGSPRVWRRFATSPSRATRGTRPTTSRAR